MPTRIKIAQFAWFIASVFESGIVVALTQSRMLPLIGDAMLLIAVCVHWLILLHCLKRRRWAFGSLVMFAPLSLLWWALGKPWLAPLGILSFPVVTAFIGLRFGALVLIRQQASATWIALNTTGATFWLARKSNLLLGRREQLLQIVAAILLGPALIGYVTGWNRLAVLVCIVMAMTLVALSLVLARRRHS